MTSVKGNGRSLGKQLAAVVRNLLDLSIAAARPAVNRCAEILGTAITIEAIGTCSRCHREAAGNFLIWRDDVWCLDCYDRARGGTVLRPDPLAGGRADDELGLVN